MSLLRPGAALLLRHQGETALALALAGCGLWLALGRGGWILGPAGLALAGLGGPWALIAWRRARFRGAVGSPGLVEIDEGRIRYLHPQAGGEVALAELAELRLVGFRGRLLWRLGGLRGEVLLVPLDAAGAEDLFDAFAVLPGLSSHDLVAALDGLKGGLRGQEAGTRPLPAPAPALREAFVWQRAGSGLRPR